MILLIDNKSFINSSNLKKLACYTAGLLLIAVGINVSKAGGLGISPASSAPYALETIWGIELGQATRIINVFLIALQIVLLRKRYKMIQLLQFLTIFVLSVFITYTSRNYPLLSWLPNPANYAAALAYTIFSSIVIGVGVSLYLIPKWIPMPPEGLAVTLTQLGQGKMPIHNAKNCVDISLVIIAIALSLAMQGKVSAVREGTVIIALLVGRFVGIGNKIYKEKILNWIDEK